MVYKTWKGGPCSGEGNEIKGRRGIPRKNPSDEITRKGLKSGTEIIKTETITKEVRRAWSDKEGGILTIEKGKTHFFRE